MVEAETEKRGVDMLELVEGVEALKEAILDVCECWRGSVAENAHHLPSKNHHCRMCNSCYTFQHIKTSPLTMLI